MVVNKNSDFRASTPTWIIPPTTANIWLTKVDFKAIGTIAAPAIRDLEVISDRKAISDRTGINCLSYWARFTGSVNTTAAKYEISAINFFN